MMDSDFETFHFLELLDSIFLDVLEIGRVSLKGVDRSEVWNPTVYYNCRLKNPSLIWSHKFWHVIAQKISKTLAK